ncbi:MAG: DUF99 family protein [Candidatus Hermodarchaeota archaeon]
MSWTHVKALTPIVGIDDGPFTFRTSELVPLIGVVMKGYLHVEGILHQIIRVDAPASFVTEVIVKMLVSSSHLRQIRAILLNGLTFGGFGVVDLDLLFLKTQIPSIVVVDRLPDLKRIKKALLENFDDGWDRWLLVEKAGSPFPVDLNGRQVFLQFRGLPFETAQVLLQKTTKPQHTQPEALRLAHMIATSVVDINKITKEEHLLGKNELKKE